jgi:hypothetical protein
VCFCWSVCENQERKKNVAKWKMFMGKSEKFWVVIVRYLDVKVVENIDIFIRLLGKKMRKFG